MRRGSVAIGLLTVLLATAPLSAHHVFDRTRPVHLTGIVTKAVFVNPHAFIYMDVTGSKGTATRWIIACGSAAALRRVGVNEMLLRSGTEITVDGYGIKNRLNWADGTMVTFKDGRKLPLAAVFMEGLKPAPPKPS